MKKLLALDSAPFMWHLIVSTVPGPKNVSTHSQKRYIVSIKGPEIRKKNGIGRITLKKKTLVAG